MSNKPINRLAWVWCTATIVAGVTAFGFLLAVRPADDSILRVIEGGITLIGFMAFAITGTLILSRQPQNIVGWLLMLLGNLAYLWPINSYFETLDLIPADPSFWFNLGLWVWGWSWLLLVFPTFLILLFFPTGSLLSRRWRWILVSGLGLFVSFFLSTTFATEWAAPDASWRVTNPMGFLPADAFPMPLRFVLLLVFAALCATSLFVRFRRAQAVEREQIKWLLYAGGLYLAILSINFATSKLGTFFYDLSGVLSFLAILAFPVAIGIAILRYRLYDINIIIRKTLQYVLVTGLLALIYFSSIILMQTVFGSVVGEQSPVVIVISTLLIAALFTPLRRRVQEVIDRRFYRQKYDAQLVLSHFAVTARDETDLDALTGELQRVVGETIQPEGIGIWLKQSQRL